MIIEELKRLREMIDDYYSMTEPHSKIEGREYLEIDNQINKIQGMVMSLILTGKEPNYDDV